jgi:hypothetical protein
MLNQTGHNPQLKLVWSSSYASKSRCYELKDTCTSSTNASSNGGRYRSLTSVDVAPRVTSIGNDRQGHLVPIMLSSLCGAS